MGDLLDEVYEIERSNGLIQCDLMLSKNSKIEFTDVDDEEKKKVVGILQVIIGPDGLPLRRNNSDYNSFFYTNCTVRSFTHIDEFSV